MTADVQLGFTQVGLDENPHVIIEWGPKVHTQEVKEDTDGTWVMSDTTVLEVSNLAHADYPPKHAMRVR
jgi:hypothetical protein